MVFTWPSSRQALGYRAGALDYLVLLELQLVEHRVAPIVAQQLVVAAGLHDAAAVDHQDAVGMHDGCEPMRDRDGGAAAAELGDRFLHVALGLGVERRGGLIEQDDWRILDQRARDCDALALAAGELEPVLADLSGVAVREAHDEVMRMRGLGG